MFDALVPPDPVPIQQSNAFAAALEGVSNPPLRLADGTLVLRRRFGPLPVAMITRPKARTPQEVLEIVQSVPGKGPRIIAPDHPMPLNRIGAIPLVSPTYVATLDLTQTKQDLMAGLHQKWRNRLRHAQQQSLRITRQNLPDDPGHWMLQADRTQQNKRGYRSWPIALTLAYARENRGQAKLFTAFWGREPVAAMLMLRHGTGATYHIGHTRSSGRIVSAHTLLMWSAMCWAKTKGAQQLELGVIDTEDGHGLARFKLGTGAQARALGGTWVWWPPVTSLFRPVARLDQHLMRLG